MDTGQFLERVLPKEGKKVLTLVMPTENGGSWFKYKSFDTAQQAAEAAVAYDAQGETVYFAVNSFGDWYHDELKDKKRIRTQSNVHACRSLIDDFDVDSDDDKKYATRQEALGDIIKLAQTLRLTPTITSSGGGYHAYFHLDSDVDKTTWEELSALKRDVSTHMNMKADRAVDMDSSRILRPIGTHNRKTDTPVPVVLVKEGKTYSVDKVRETLQNYIRDNEVQPAPTNRKIGEPSPFSVLSGDFPTSDADLVAKNCAAVREFKESGGNISEPHWHRAIGIVKFCKDGEAAIHEWSEGHTIIAKLKHKRRLTSGQLGQHPASRWTNTSVVEKPVRFRTSANSHFPLGTQKRSKARKKKATSPTVTQVQRRLSKVSPYHIGQQMAIVGTALHSPGRSPTTTA